MLTPRLTGFVSHAGFSNIKAYDRKKTRHVPVEITESFDKEVKELFAVVTKVFSPLLASNNDFHMSILSQKEIRLKVGDLSERGAYVIQCDSKDEVIRINYPYGGNFEYAYDTETKQWLSVMDKHDMRGMLTRELLKHCVGCPIFP